ncbi:transcriptional regulator domain-containing protein [Pseudaminobacter soli (ex Li et al. 2025)]|uniref:transcriptional regulator domain-containing protein n=1 Tax=Pseudaminobacter soli (ex Li et al. 2025) TaxID=1295366 RepID=UPI002473B9D4|nr:DUF6499 domain-containing protein [Mesorhizobium soli]
MKPNSTQWRSPTAYDFTSHATADALAWEFLRRNPIYQHEFAELLSTGVKRDSPSLDRLRRRWGLRFPSQS